MQLWRRDRDTTFVSNRTSTIQDEELLDAYSSAVVGVVEAVSPSVVHVQVRGSRQGRPAQGSGSGTILSPDGLVLTNNHVVEGASAIELALTDSRRVPARILGRDPDTDIAVLRAETTDRLPAARLGNSKRIRPGQIAIAIGNPFGFEFDRHRRHRQRGRPLAARAERPPDRRRHPDRRRPQPRQLRRAARQLARRGDRRQHGRHHGRAGHLLLGRLQHGPARADPGAAARPRAAGQARHCRRPGAPAAAAAGEVGADAGVRRARRRGAGRQPGDGRRPRARRRDRRPRRGGRDRHRRHRPHPRRQSRIDKRVSIRILREERLETVDIVPTERLPER